MTVLFVYPCGGNRNLICTLSDEKFVFICAANHGISLIAVYNFLYALKADFLVKHPVFGDVTTASYSEELKKRIREFNATEKKGEPSGNGNRKIIQNEARPLEEN